MASLVRVLSLRWTTVCAFFKKLIQNLCFNLLIKKKIIVQLINKKLAENQYNKTTCRLLLNHGTPRLHEQTKQLSQSDTTVNTNKLIITSQDMMT
jgi:hypothetical protein